MNQLTFFAAEHLVNRSPLRDCAREWMTHAETSRSPILPSLDAIAPAGWFGRMSPASFHPSATPRPIHVRRRIQWIWSATDKKWQQKKITIQEKHTLSNVSSPVFQNSGMGGPTECLTLSSVEQFTSPKLYRSAATVSSLSDILETGDVPQRYYLTAKACRGILRRAEKRWPMWGEDAVREVKTFMMAQGWQPVAVDFAGNVVKSLAEADGGVLGSLGTAPVGNQLGGY